MGLMKLKPEVRISSSILPKRDFTPICPASICLKHEVKTPAIIMAIEATLAAVTNYALVGVGHRIKRGAPTSI